MDGDHARLTRQGGNTDIEVMGKAREVAASVVQDFRYADAIIKGRCDSDELILACALAIIVERERCAKVADRWEARADAKFDGCIADHDKGHRNLQLAAAACAGMSHQARHIAAAIRKGGAP